MSKKDDLLAHFVRQLSPEAAERFGYGLGRGLSAALPAAAQIHAREMARNTLSVRELWEMAGMGESHFYKLVREGRGPRRIAEGSSHMVTVEEARRWLGELERESGRRG